MEELYVYYSPELNELLVARNLEYEMSLVRSERYVYGFNDAWITCHNEDGYKFYLIGIL